MSKDNLIYLFEKWNSKELYLLLSFAKELGFDFTQDETHENIVKKAV